MTTVDDDLRQRLVGYMRENAAKGKDSIRELVEKGHADLLGKLGSMSDEQARFKPAPDIWSALEVMAHVVTAKRGTARICEMLSRGERPRDFGGEGEDKRSAQDGVTRGSFATVAEARDAAQAEHDRLLAFIDGVSPNDDTTTTYPHFIFGELNGLQWAVFQRVHDGDHARQLDQIVSAEGYPA